MSTSEPRSPAGISYFDVERYLRQVQRDHNGICGFDIGVPVRPAIRTAVTVRCWFRRGLAAPGGDYYERGVSLGWPTHQCRTFVGLLFRLVIELDKKLSDEAEELARAKNGRLPGF